MNNSLDNNKLDHDKAGADRLDKAQRERRFEQRARQVWREAAQHIDPATAGRLRAARREALQAAQQPARHVVRWLIPSGAFAVIALAALMVWQPLPPRDTHTAMQSTSIVDEADTELPPDADKTDPNLYQNLDFYDWLASTNSAPTNH